MPRKTVRVDIPVHRPDDFTKLLKSVREQHAQLGSSSPLFNSTVVDMAAFDAKTTQALALREEAQKLYAQAQARMQDSRVLMGLDEGQTINTEGTLYYMLDLVKRTLLTHYPGVEETLSTWGFNVVIRHANVGRKRKK
jgi:hypothetical protein